MDINDFSKLSSSKRILLAQQLWDSVLDKEFEISDAIKSELDNRLTEHEKGNMKYFSREEINEKLKDSDFEN